MMMSSDNDSGHEFERDLQELIRNRQVVAVIGSGVSRATNTQSPSWPELIESAVKRCGTLDEAVERGETFDKTVQWYQMVRNMLALEDPSMLLAAAELIEQRLRERGELARWLSNTFRSLQPEDPTVIRLLKRLVSWDVPLMTTNYDGLIEAVMDLGYVCWTDYADAQSVVRGDDRRVLHLHGHWERPDSVVLGIRSYEAIRNSQHPQDILKALGMTKSFLFVGCGGSGLSDPNLGRFLDWLAAQDTSAGVRHRHYSLVRRCEVFPTRGRLFPLVFGDDFGDLPKFLDRVLPERETASPAGGQTAGTTRLPPALPASVTCYLQRLADENEHLSLLGLGRSLQIELPISTAYVPLRTTLARSLELHETERYRSGRAEHEEDVDLSDVFRKAEERGLRGVVLLGEPGSGKTTGARQTTWRLSSRQCLPEDLGLPPGMTPVFLRFRHLRADVLQAADGLREFLIAETYCRYAPDDRQSPGPELWNGQAGGLLWILDGLDEVIDPQARATVSTWIQQALQHRPADRFLVTCRFQGYFRPGVPLGPKFVEFHVRPLDDGQVRHFAHAWFDAAYQRLDGPGPLAADRARAASEELLEILACAEFQAGHIRELCTNPLLLTILCIVFHEERKLPTGRADLYAHCVRVLLEDWRRDVYQAGLSTKLQPYDAGAAQSVLAGIAWWMHQQQDRTAAPLDQLAQQAALGLAQLSPGTGLGRDGAGFLLRMRDGAGILALEGEGRCGFLHLSFQEFLAADHAAREGLARELAALAAKTDGSWWREVALLSLRRSRPFCEAFFREMLAAGVAEDHPDLAERCLTESLYFVPEPFVEALQQPAPADEAGRRRHQARIAAILRLLRERADQVPELAEISRRYAESADRPIRGFAAEILARRSGAPESAMRDKEVYVHPQTGIALVTIPAGRFMMGSEQGDSDERPVHEVRIPRDFLLGKYPVTNAQYARFLEATGSSVSKPEYWDDRRFNQPEQPVVGVSWDEARKFCEWAGGRLPSEAEWEYACRAGTTTEYSFDDDPAQLGEYGWFKDNSGGQTPPVGTKLPNPWGLFDMHGNVWECCEDVWHDSYDGAPDDGSARVDRAAERSDRVIRGGCWASLARDCRCAYRGRWPPASRFDGLGFRFVFAARFNE